MARRIIRNLYEPQIRSSMSDELIGQTFINKLERLRRAPGRTGRRSHADLHRELSVTNLLGLAEPPEEGSSALPAGTYEGQTVLVTGGGTGLGPSHRGRVRPARGQPGGGEPQGRTPRRRPRRHRGRPGPDRGRHLRHQGSRADRHRLRPGHRGIRPARRADQQRRRQLPRAGRGHVAQCVADGGRHHAQRDVLHGARVRPSPPERRGRPAPSSTSGRRTPGRVGPGSPTRPRRRPA